MEAALRETLQFVQATTGGLSSFGADRVVAYKVEAMSAAGKGLPRRA
jgi:hypothetical protein